MKIRVRHIGYLLLFIVYIVSFIIFADENFSFKEESFKQIASGLTFIIFSIIIIGYIVYYIIENENDVIFNTKRKEY